MKMKELKEKIKAEKSFRNKFIAIVTACVAVIAVAVIVPICVHNSNVAKEPDASNTTEQGTVGDIVLTTSPAYELTTEATTVEETTAETTTAKPAVTQSVTKASTTKPAKGNSTTKVSTTKPKPTESDAKSKLPPAIANSNTGYPDAAKVAEFEEDARIAANAPVGYCENCGKPIGHGTHGTCGARVRDGNCPLCGVYVKAYECHSCKY